MSTSTYDGQQAEVAARPDWVGKLAPGLVAGMVFAMWAMVVGIFTSTLWAPPQGIAQAVGLGHAGHDFQLLPFVLGIMGHMMNSAIFGILFAALAITVVRLRGVLLVAAGMMYGLAVYAVLYYPVLRGLLASTSGSFLSSNPEWSWVLAHLMYGVMLGGLLAYGPLARARQRS